MNENPFERQPPPEEASRIEDPKPGRIPLRSRARRVCALMLWPGERTPEPRDPFNRLKRRARRSAWLDQ